MKVKVVTRKRVSADAVRLEWFRRFVGSCFGLRFTSLGHYLRVRSPPVSLIFVLAGSTNSALRGHSDVVVGELMALRAVRQSVVNGQMLPFGDRFNMPGIEARTIVTEVMKVMSIRNWTSPKKVSGAMCWQLLPIKSNLTIASHPSAGPFPAAVRCDHSLHQHPIFGRHVAMWFHTLTFCNSVSNSCLKVGI